MSPGCSRRRRPGWSPGCSARGSCSRAELPGLPGPDLRTRPPRRPRPARRPTRHGSPPPGSRARRRHLAGLLQLELPDRRRRATSRRWPRSCTPPADLPAECGSGSSRSARRAPTLRRGRSSTWRARSSRSGRRSPTGPASTRTGSLARSRPAQTQRHRARAAAVRALARRHRHPLHRPGGRAALVPPAQRRPACPGRSRARHGARPGRAAAAARGRLGPGRGHPGRQRAGCGCPSWPASSRCACYTRHITALDPQSLLAAERAAARAGAGRLRHAAAQLAASPIVPGALAPAWRRLARPLGTLAVRQGRPAGAPVAGRPGRGGADEQRRPSRSCPRPRPRLAR